MIGFWRLPDLKFGQLADDVLLALAGQFRVLRVGGIAVHAVAGAADRGLGLAGGGIAGLDCRFARRSARVRRWPDSPGRPRWQPLPALGLRLGFLGHQCAGGQCKREGYGGPENSGPKTSGPKTHTLVSRETC